LPKARQIPRQVGQCHTKKLPKRSVANAGRRKKVIWTKQGYSTLDEAVAYVAQDSLTAAQQLLESALDMAESLTVFDERGRIVPELEQPSVRELLVQRYRLIYEVFDTKVEILAFIHGARDFAKWRQSLSGEAG
jgi:plasmid stabilization system protein ParE